MSEEAIDRAVARLADRLAVDGSGVDGSAVESGPDLTELLHALARGPHPPHSDSAPPSTPEASADLASGSPIAEGAFRWGKYVLALQVGSGSFGTVYRAWDPDLELHVAMKILHRRIDDPAQRESLLREGRALARVKHENVVRVLGIETHDNQIALRMEFVHGETLDHIVGHHGTLNAREAALVGEDVCRALAAVHLAGFVHRDVKAGNIMREQAGRIVLMDFGAGHYAAALREAGRVPNIGTPLYMAPEVIFGAPATPASDVYSVGVLLYYLVSGEYPVDGESLTEIRLAHMARSHRRLIGRRPDLPVAFTQVVERALSADLHERYATAGEMADALHSIFNPPAAVTPRQPTSNRLWRRLATAVAVSIVVVAIGMLNSLAFDYGLGRADFVDESISVWAWWGIRSVLGMTFTLLLAVFGLAALLSVHRVALASSRRCRGVHERVVALGSRLGGRLHLDDSQTWGPLLLILSGALLVGAWIAYQPLLADLLLAGDLPSAPADKLHLLSPVNRLYQNDYRKAFTGVVLAVGAAWYLVWRSQPTSGDRFQRVWLAGLGAVFVLAIFSLNLPFRLLYHAQFDAVRWHGAGCYLLGERNREALIFCPTLTPRNRIVADAPGEIERLQRKENIFTSF